MHVLSDIDYNSQRTVMVVLTDLDCNSHRIVNAGDDVCCDYLRSCNKLTPILCNMSE